MIDFDKIGDLSFMIEDYEPKKIKKAKKLIDTAVMALAEAYQIVGNESYKKQNNEETIS